MKSSEILREALERMDGGKKWMRGIDLSSERLCSLESIAEINPDTPKVAIRWLKKAVGVRYIAPWNDEAPTFSVIQQGFERAIQLAEAEGD